MGNTASSAKKPEKKESVTKEQYRDYLLTMAVAKEKTVPRFDLLGEVLPSFRDEETLTSLVGEIRKVIKIGNTNGLKTCLGPLIYPHRLSANQRIANLRWEWIAAREKVDLYAQAFNLAVWYLRKHIFERGFPVELNRVERLIRSAASPPVFESRKVRRTNYSSTIFRRGDGVFIVTPKVWVGESEQLECVKTSRLSPELVQRYQREIEPIKLCLKAYEDRDIVELRSPKDLVAYGIQFRENFSAEVFRDLCTYAARLDVPELSASKKNHLRDLLIASLKELSPMLGAEHISVLGKGSFVGSVGKTKSDKKKEDNEDAVRAESPPPSRPGAPANERAVLVISSETLSVLQKYIAQHAYQNPRVLAELTAEINRIFAEEAGVQYILHSLHQCFKENCEAVRQIRKEYRGLTEAADLKKQEAQWIAEYREFIELTKSAADVNGILRNELGHICLANLELASANQFLEEAIAHCESPEKRPRLKQYLAVAAELIGRGYSLFELDRFKDPQIVAEPHWLVTREDFPWELLVASLNSMLCITPVAEQVRQVLLAYAQKLLGRDDKTDTIGSARRGAVTSMLWLLHKSQEDGNLLEEAFIAEMMDQIKSAPRGLWGQSRLCQQLQMILARKKLHELMDTTEKLELRNISGGLFAEQARCLLQDAPLPQSVEGYQEEEQAETDDPYQPRY